MSDYTQSTDFSAKDALASGNPLKVIKGSDIDAELALISTAIATKYDSTDLASQAQAQAGTSNTVLMTPLRVQEWGDANGGMVGDIQALADPDADQLLGWDDSASAVVGFTMGNGLNFSGATLVVVDSEIAHDSLSGFVANEHIDHSGVSITAGDGLTGGGTIAATRSLAVASTIAGTGLTFSAGVINVIGGDGITANANDIEVDSTVVRTTGTQTIGGAKTFSSNVNFNADVILGNAATDTIGFYGDAGTTKPEVTGNSYTSEGEQISGLNSLLTALSNMGLIVDSVDRVP